MKIAVASTGKSVSSHFGHCEGFTIYDVNEGEPLNRKYIPNPGHRPGYLPRYLKDLNVDVIISAGIGDPAKQLLSENGIEIVISQDGFCDEVVQKYITGKKHENIER